MWWHCRKNDGRGCRPQATANTAIRNSIDLYVLGDRAIHVLIGMPVLSVTSTTGGNEHLPLTRGKIQLQSEGAETFFRNVTLRQIEKLPVIGVRK